MLLGREYVANSKIFDWGNSMSRYKLEFKNEQHCFQNRDDARDYINSLPYGTPVTVTDTEARQNDDAYFSYISGVEGCVVSRHLPISPLSNHEY